MSILTGGCNSLTPNRGQSSVSPEDTVVMKDTGSTTKLQNITPDLLPAVENPPASARVLTEADKQYIDWIIPDYPDVIVWHEGRAETLRYTEEIYRYVQLKNGSVQKKTITQKYTDKARDERFYIADVGENWYEVYIFDDWK
ncbi:MAG TPA: hypothetical protein PLL71_07370 [Agriterribacter sp.]|nr:hypothetical protein [Agriterribacter sp.]HRQ52170.1 hypothetical protein [Agriterribacter sp.]